MTFRKMRVQGPKVLESKLTEPDEMISELSDKYAGVNLITKNRQLPRPSLWVLPSLSCTARAPNTIIRRQRRLERIMGRQILIAPVIHSYPTSSGGRDCSAISLECESLPQEWHNSLRLWHMLRPSSQRG